MKLRFLYRGKINSFLKSSIIHKFSAVEGFRKSRGWWTEVWNEGHLLPVIVNCITDVNGDFTRESYGVYIENIKDDADERSLGTTSRETLW